MNFCASSAEIVREAVDPRFSKGVELFWAGDYFECHEVIEELWMETPESDPLRNLYKGVIQVAAAIYQLDRGILSGALGLYRTGAAYLEPYRPKALGADLEAILKEVHRRFEGRS